MIKTTTMIPLLAALGLAPSSSPARADGGPEPGHAGETDDHLAR